MNNPIDYLKIAVITWGAVFVINRALKAAGLSQFAATQSAKAAS
jgi:hypothetical protein